MRVGAAAQALALILFLLLNKVFAEYLDYSSSGKYCFSCMSEDFQLHWSFLDKIYYRPANFTDHCYGMPPNVYIGMTPCSHSMCVTVVEPRILAGQHIGNNVIRGCFSSVFKFGSTPRAQSSPILGQLCNDYPATATAAAERSGVDSHILRLFAVIIVSLVTIFNKDPIWHPLCV